MALGTPVAGLAAYSAASGTSVAPAYPSGILATDAVLLFVGQKPTTANGGTVTTPTGWTLQEELTGAGGYGTTIGADVGNTNLRVYSWDTPVAGQTGTLSVTLGGNNVSWAFIVRVPTGGGTLSYGTADGQRTTTPTSPMAIALTNGATATNFEAGDKAIWAMCIPTDVTTPSQFSSEAVTATGAVFATATELNEPDSGNGNDIGGYSAYAHVNSGSSTTAPTVTATLAGTLTNVRGPVVLVRIRETALPPAQTLTPSLETNTSSIFSPTVSAGTVTLNASLFTSENTFYVQEIDIVGGPHAVEPSLYSNVQTFYSPSLVSNYPLAASLLTNSNTFYSPSVEVKYVVTPSRADNTSVFYTAVITQQAAAQSLTQTSSFVSTNTFYLAEIDNLGADHLIEPPLFTNTSAFYSPTFTTGTTYVMKYWTGTVWQIIYKDPTIY